MKIAISGQMCSGKTTIANLIKNQQPKELEKLFLDAKSARDSWLKD